jgi:hypothetical protein
MAFIHSPKIVTDGLVLALDAGNVKSYASGSTTWLDKSGRGNNGTLINGPTFNSGNGGSIVFDGVDDYCLLPVDIGNGYAQITSEILFVPLNLTTNKDWKFIIASGDSLTSSPATSVFTMGFNQLTSTVNIPSNFLGLNLWFGVNTGPNSTRVRAIVDNTAWSGYLSGVAVSVNHPNLTVGTPIHITGVYNGVDTVLYVNGSLSATSISQPDGVNRSTTGNLIFDTSSKSVGGSALELPRSTNTQISTFKIYNRALTADEVLQNFNALRGRFGI